MASFIKNRLKGLCDTDSSLNSLWAQWTFDEKLISKALNNISQNFPHYSLHDASHSNQIVTNIERILGEQNINLLSATDLWLILEAAYCHDIGMVITSKKVREDWNNPEFADFLFELKNNEQHELNSLAIKYFDNVNKLEKSSSWQLDTLDEIRLLLAEFYRRRHASYSANVIKNPYLEIGLNSPRNELLPNRLFKTLALVSSHHGYSFEDVMKLPKVEVGLGNDNAHPRYVACLLRLGDLLDLDDNRFCPVMLETAGKLPNSTHAHIDKHLSIEHFRMDQERIEVVASCESYDGYIATSSWFEYLEKEINQQMSNWNDIVPMKEMGLLPTIGRLDIELKGYELLSRDKTPKFEVDAEKMFSLIQGSGLYDKPEQCIRELLQNAADTTLLRLWCDKNILGKHKHIEFITPSKDLNTILVQNYSINIEINEAPSSNNDEIEWEIIIEDKGMGITKSGLQYLQKIGSSNKDLKKKKLIDEMPYWLKPSGAFGIGFQSVFMLTKQVQIKSKSFYEGNVIFVELNDPNEQKSGNIFIRKGSENYKHETGTQFKFTIKTNAVPSRFSYSFDDKKVVAEINNYDFVQGSVLNVEILKVIHQIIQFAEHSYIPIKLKFKDEIIDIEQIGFDGEGFFHDTGLRISTHNKKDELTFSNAKCASILRFKGQVLESTYPTPFCSLDIDILGFNADEYLEINRNKLKKAKEDLLFNEIDTAVKEYLLNVRQNKTGLDRDFIDAFIISLTPIPEFIADESNIYLGLDLPLNESATTTTKDILERNECVINFITIKSRQANERQDFSITEEKDSATITVDEYHNSETLKLLSTHLLPKYFCGLDISIREDENKIIKVVKYTKTNQCIIDDSVYKHIFDNSYRDRWPRMVFFCPDDFIALAVNQDNIGFSEWLHHYTFRDVHCFNRNVMVLPFKSGDRKFDYYNIDNLSKWVFENRINPSVTENDIKEAYEKFILHIRGLFN